MGAAFSVDCRKMVLISMMAWGELARWGGSLQLLHRVGVLMFIPFITVRMFCNGRFVKGI